MSKTKMEIIIPSNAGAVQLCTANKYCTDDIIVKNSLGFKVVTGTFMLDNDLTGGSAETPEEEKTNNKLVISGLPTNTMILKIQADKAPVQKAVINKYSDPQLYRYDFYHNLLVISTAPKNLGERNSEHLCWSYAERIQKIIDGVPSFMGSAGNLGSDAFATVDESTDTLTITYIVHPDGYTVNVNDTGADLLERYWLLSHDIIGYEAADLNGDGDTADGSGISAEGTAGAPIRGEQITYTWTAYCWDV